MGFRPKTSSSGAYLTYQSGHGLQILPWPAYLTLYTELSSPGVRPPSPRLFTIQSRHFGSLSSLRVCMLFPLRPAPPQLLSPWVTSLTPFLGTGEPARELSPINLLLYFDFNWLTLLLGYTYQKLPQGLLEWMCSGPRGDTTRSNSQGVYGIQYSRSGNRFRDGNLGLFFFKHIWRAFCIKAWNSRAWWHTPLILV